MAQRFLSNIRINDAYTLPASDGTAGQVIGTDGTGNLSFVDIASGGAPVMYKDDFVGDGIETVFQLANPVGSVIQTQLYIDGVYQEKETYSVDGTNITFTTAPPSGTSIEVISITGINFAGDFTVDSLQFTGGTGTQGTLSWNADEETLDLVQNGATLQLGQEIQVHVKNQTGSTIPDATPVYVTGTLGTSGRLTVAPMIADGSIPARFFLGVTTEPIADGDDGKVTTFGKIRGVDTSIYTEGQTLFVSATTAGAFQTTAPVSPNLDLEVAIVINSDANNGTLFVRAQNGYYLGMLHDVALSGLADKDLLVYNNTAGVWENSKTLGDITTGNITTSGTVDGVDISSFKSQFDNHLHDDRYYTETEIGQFFGGSVAITGYNKSNWDTAFSWGDHDGLYLPITHDMTLTLGGDLSGSVTFTDMGNATLNATINANSVALGTDTTGNYMVNVAAGGGISVSHTQGEGSTATVSHADTSSAANLTASGRTYVTGLTFDTYGHVTGYTTGTETVVDTNTTYSAGGGLSLAGTVFSHTDTSSQASVNNSGGTVIQDVTLDTYGHVTGLSSVNLDSRYLQSYTETDTLNSVTSRGGTTANAITVGGLVVEGSLDSGGTDYGYYQQAGTNIILKGDSQGRSGIFFQSEKNGTTINHPSDYGFIQFHSYGFNGTTGESNVLSIGVANDSTDTVVLQSPYNGGVKVGYKDATSGTGLSLATVYHDNYHPTADRWTTARIITLAGAVTGSTSIDGSGNVTINTTNTADPVLTLAGDATGTATFTNLGNATLTVTVVNDSHTHDTRYYTEAESDARFVIKNTGYEWTATGAGALSFRSLDTIDTASGDQASLEVYQDTAGADAFMQFHINGDYAKYFGLHGGINDFVIGGWSHGASYQRIFHDGYHPNADTLTTARTINGTSFNGSANITTANWGTSRTLTIGGTGKSVNGGGNVSWSLSEIGAAASSHTHSAADITSGTLADARLVGTYSGITLQTNGGNTHVTTPNSGSASTNDRTVFGLAQYKSDSSAAVGAIVFYAPNTNSTIMHRLRIEGMIYAGGPTVACIIQGYRTTGAWSNTSKVNLGITDVQVRFGVNPQGRNCVILGDTNTTWSYPMMAITHAMFSHSGVTDAYCKDWTVGLVTSFSGFTNITGTLGNNSIATSITGSAPTLTTSRTINGTSFNGSANITTANWGTARTLTIGNTGKSVNGSGNVSWSLTEIGAPSTTGSGASGTWGISISGNASTATTLQTARTINGTSFNGSANITTANWGTARTINGVSVNGSTNYTLEPYVEDDESSVADKYITFVDDSTAGFKRLNEDSALKYNPNNNQLIVPSLNISGTIFNPGYSTANNGYTKLPNGFVLQWGRYTQTGSSAIYSFPSVFPTAVLGIWATKARLSGGSSTQTAAAAVGLLSNSQFYLDSNDAGGSSFTTFILAIGR